MHVHMYSVYYTPMPRHMHNCLGMFLLLAEDANASVHAPVHGHGHFQRALLTGHPTSTQLVTQCRQQPHTLPCGPYHHVPCQQVPQRGGGGGQSEVSQM